MMYPLSTMSFISVARAWVRALCVAARPTWLVRPARCVASVTYPGGLAHMASVNRQRP